MKDDKVELAVLITILAAIVVITIVVGISLNRDNQRCGVNGGHFARVRCRDEINYETRNVAANCSCVCKDARAEDGR